MLIRMLVIAFKPRYRRLRHSDHPSSILHFLSEYFYCYDFMYLYVLFSPCNIYYYLCFFRYPSSSKNTDFHRVWSFKSAKLIWFVINHHTPWLLEYLAMEMWNQGLWNNHKYDVYRALTNYSYYDSAASAQFIQPGSAHCLSTSGALLPRCCLLLHDRPSIVL